jgi:hypothetical protein
MDNFSLNKFNKFLDMKYQLEDLLKMYFNDSYNYFKTYRKSISIDRAIALSEYIDNTLNLYYTIVKKSC